MLKALVKLKEKLSSRSFNQFLKPLNKLLPKITPLKAKGDRPLQMEFNDQINTLIYYHIQEHKSGRELLQDLAQNSFAEQNIAPEKGIKKSSFFEAINTRGLEQAMEVFQGLQEEASKTLPVCHKDFGELRLIDGSLINAVLSMDWAKYRENYKKAKAHIAFDINRGLPFRIFVTDGNAGERRFVDQMIEPGQTSVMDRGYQCHASFDRYQSDGRHFICRIKENTIRTVVQENQLPSESIVFYDSEVYLGTESTSRTKQSVRIVAYTVEGKNYWIATDRRDLTAEQIAEAYKLRWGIETFFKWWKQHLSVYHILARSEYGLKVQIFAGLITYLLLAIYCHEEFGEKVSIYRLRELRHKIFNEVAGIDSAKPIYKKKKISAKT